jgi:N-acetylglucosaminyldiphosphoundecaprenol N-acetyl-beta-D-mannosaminyltransferase
LKKYFNINFEFNINSILNKIDNAINNKIKNYVCIIDGNVLLTTTKDSSYLNIINNSLVNCCDGSSITLLIKLIYNKNYKTFTGPQLLSHYIKTNNNHVFLGNTIEIQKKMQSYLLKHSLNNSTYNFIPLPFNNVDDFDYVNIAKSISDCKSQIVWVSLGAPKQELFINKLLPFISSGILIGIGGAINLYLDELDGRRSPKFVRKFGFEWLFRVIKEPLRIGSRAFVYLINIPKIIISEIKNKNR